ncbi:tol-pal system YbgF family protein [candidate division KSB1 bacterium]
MQKFISFLSVLMIASLCLTPVFAQDAETDSKKDEAKPQVTAEFMNNVWKNVNKITKEKRSFEVEKATTVAGVRGKEAQDEALSKLYFKGGDSFPSRVELQQAVKVLQEQLKAKPADAEAAEINYYIAQCQIQLGDKAAASKTFDEIVAKYGKTKWAKMAKEGKAELSD